MLSTAIAAFGQAVASLTAVQLGLAVLGVCLVVYFTLLEILRVQHHDCRPRGFRSPSISLSVSLHLSPHLSH
jgi:hypothetical protein